MAAGAREWTLVAASLVAALLLAEAACRLLLPRPGFIPEYGGWMAGAIRPHPARGYALVPGFAARITDPVFGSMRVEVDEAGLRERPLAPLLGAQWRVLAIGDSFTFGTGLEAEEAWPRRLEALLEARWPDAGAAIVNAGILGYGVAQMADLAAELLPRVRPAVVVVGFYAGGLDRLRNPYTAFGDIIVRRADTRVIRRVPGGLVRSRLHQPALVAADLWLLTHSWFGARAFEGAYAVLDAARTALAPPPAVATTATDPLPGLADALGQLARIRRDAAAAGADTIVLIVGGFDAAGRTSKREQRVAAAVAAWCAREGVAFVDPTATLAASGVPLQVRPGNYHWSAAAHGVAAAVLADRLAPPGARSP